MADPLFRIVFADHPAAKIPEICEAEAAAAFLDPEITDGFVIVWRRSSGELHAEKYDSLFVAIGHIGDCWDVRDGLDPVSAEVWRTGEVPYTVDTIDWTEVR